MSVRSTSRDFRALLRPGAAVVLPGVSNALAARVVADLGFPAAYITGAGIANTYLGLPDIGLLSLPEIASHVTAISGAVAIGVSTPFTRSVRTLSVKVSSRTLGIVQPASLSRNPLTPTECGGRRRSLRPPPESIDRPRRIHSALALAFVRCNRARWDRQDHIQMGPIRCPLGHVPVF